MNEEERAKKLSDAIDAILRGDEPEMALEDQELIELLRIARLRHQAGQALADVGLTYQELLRRVLQARIVARQVEPGGEKADDAAPEVSSVMDEDPREFLDPLDPGYGKLVNLLDIQSTPARPAMANRCTMALVEPPIAMSTTIAFSNAAPVRMSDGLRSLQTISTLRRPLSEAMRA